MKGHYDPLEDGARISRSFACDLRFPIALSRQFDIEESGLSGILYELIDVSLMLSDDELDFVSAFAVEERLSCL
jgi:hypothetical protein